MSDQKIWKSIFEDWRQQNRRTTLNEVIDPATVEKIELALADAGAETYIVGGAVRDELLPDTPPSKDVDFLVRGLPLEDLIAVLQPLGKVVPAGNIFGTATVYVDGESFDFALPRKEKSTGPGHKDYSIIADHTATIESDLGRRDFTMNALAKDSEGNIIDMFGGTQDIQNKVIRAVGDPLNRFKEDPLRILRAVQFAVRFGFGIEPNTAAAMEKYASRLSKVSRERVLRELTKAWTKGRADSEHLVALLEETGIGEELFGPSFRPIPIKLEQSTSEELILGNFISFFLRGGDAERLPLSREMKLYLQLAKSAASGAPPAEYAPKHRDKLPFIIKVLNSAGYVEEASAAQEALSYPLSPQELDITGQDIMRMGYRGQDIGNTLNYLLQAVQGGQIENNYEDLQGFIQA
jgi:tRNA nucleotidyltransferase/poly(A) polymerase